MLMGKKASISIPIKLFGNMQMWFAFSLPLGKHYHDEVICVLSHTWWDAEVRNWEVSFCFQLLAFFLPACVWEKWWVTAFAQNLVMLLSFQVSSSKLGKVTDRRSNYLGAGCSKCPPMAMGDGMRCSFRSLPTQTSLGKPSKDWVFSTGAAGLHVECHSSKHNDCRFLNLWSLKMLYFYQKLY